MTMPSGHRIRNQKAVTMVTAYFKKKNTYSLLVLQYRVFLVSASYSVLLNPGGIVELYEPEHRNLPG